MSQIIDGRQLAFKKEQELKEKIKQLNLQKRPRVVDFCTFSQPGAKVYLNLKVKKAQELGISFKLVEIEGLGFENFKEKIIKENNNPRTCGVMIQVPLPSELWPYQEELINLIDPKKDVDGLRLDGQYPSATAQAVVELLESINTSFKDDYFVVVGSEGVEGGAIVKLLEKKGAVVVGVDKKDRSSSFEKVKEADVVISATGQKQLITAEMVKDGVVAIDVGLGEFSEDIYQKASFYTPKMGGVGPMTIICLMENVIKAVGK